MQEVFDMNIIDVSNRDRSLIQKNMRDMAKNMLPSLRPDAKESRNLIGIVRKVNPDLTADVFLPSLAKTIRSVSFVQPGFGATSGVIISPEEGMPCMVSKTVDKRWYAYGSITFKSGVSPRALKESEIELYSGVSSLKMGVGGRISVSSGALHSSTAGDTSIISNILSASAENVDIISGSVEGNGERTGYIRITVYKSAPVSKPFTLSESRDISNKANMISVSIQELLEDIKSASFENDITYIRDRVRMMRDIVCEPREAIATIEIGAAIDSEIESSTDLEKVDSKYIIRDRGIPCIYRFVLYSGGERTLERRIYENGEEVLI